jgi:drug/metabolite transporter (DMT)-like permease
VVLLLALGAALAYGVSDFVAGVAARRVSAWAVAAASQAVAAAVIVAAALLHPGAPGAADLAWGALAGLGNGAGNVLLYRGLGAGRMAVVAPLSAVATAGLPVLVGIAAGERPGTLPVAGVLLALPAIWLVSLAGPGLRAATRRDLADGLAAGVGFGVQFAALGQVAARGGLAPLAVSQLVSVISILAGAAVAGAPWVPRAGGRAGAAAAGLLAGIATVWFQLAAQRGFLSVASVLTALYPAVTVVLAAIVLGEAIGRAQGAGLALAATAVLLIAAG